jgi:beta-lactamase superfamily II metal-dependent hydrolase
MKLEVFDVGHGACALLTDDLGNRMMIDCASGGNFVPGEHLAARGVTTLEQLVITNYDEDHVRGISSLLDRVNVLWVMRNTNVSPAMIRCLKTEDGMGPGIERLVRWLETLLPPGQISPGAVLPSFLSVSQQFFFHSYGTGPSQYDDENNLSLVMFLNINGVGVLFPGDMETSGWATLLQRADFRAIVPQIKVLIASHHGRESGKCEEFFSVHGCNPYFVVISDKGYMHESQETVAHYRSRSIGGPFRGEHRHVLTTRSDATITFNFTTDKWWAA